jgi:hypothetical protein
MSSQNKNVGSQKIRGHKNVSYEAQFCPFILKSQRAPNSQTPQQIINTLDTMRGLCPAAQTLEPKESFQMHPMVSLTLVLRPCLAVGRHFVFFVVSRFCTCWLSFGYIISIFSKFLFHWKMFSYLTGKSGMLLSSTNIQDFPQMFFGLLSNVLVLCYVKHINVASSNHKCSDYGLLHPSQFVYTSCYLMPEKKTGSIHANKIIIQICNIVLPLSPSIALVL